MTIAWVQQGDNRAASATTTAVTLIGVTAGSLLVFNCMRLGTNRTLTVTTSPSDTVQEAVAETLSSVSGDQCEVAIDYVPVATGGDTTITLTASANATIELDCFEFTHDGTASLDQFSTGDNATGTSHVCAASGQIDTAAGAVVVTCIQCSGTLAGGTPPSGYTMSVLAGNTRSGYKGPGTYTNEDASQTTVNSRYSIGAVASFAEVGGGPAGHPAIKRMGGIPYMARNRGVW